MVFVDWFREYDPREKDAIILAMVFLSQRYVPLSDPSISIDKE